MPDEDRPSGPALTFSAPVFRVSDMEAAMAYLTDRLGFRVQGRAGDPPDWVSMMRDSVEIMLVRGDDPPPPQDWAAYIYVKDVDALYAELETRGADLLGPPTDQPYNNREFEVRLPE